MPKKEPSVQELKRENQRLKRENMMLKNELEEFHGHQRKETGNKYVDTLRRQAKNEQLFSKKRYLGYLTEALRRTSVFQIYSRIIHAFRRISFIRISLLVILAILTAVQTSAVFVLATSFFVVSLPFTLLISNSAMILTFFGRRKINGDNRQHIEGKAVTVFFPPRGYSPDTTPFLCGMILENAEKEGHVSVVVSPYVFHARGVLGKRGRPYFASRLDSSKVILVRSAYYFTMKKRVLNSALSITELY